MIQAGKLRHVVTIQAIPNPDTIGEGGEPAGQYADVTTRRAKVEDLTGRELEHAKAVSQETSVLVTMRYYAGLTAKHRLKHGSRALDIEAVTNPDGMKVEHLIYCKDHTQ
jgi:head-tail adaptor